MSKSEFTANREGFNSSRALPETAELFNERAPRQAEAAKAKAAQPMGDLSNPATWALLED